MAEVFFYRLGKRPAISILRAVLEKSLENCWRVEVRGRTDQRIRSVDRELWRGPKDSFLPHALVGGKFEEKQPVLLSVGPCKTEDLDALVLIDGAGLEPGDVERFKRVSLIFEEGNADELSIARKEWKALLRTGVSLQYWAEEGGRWVKKSAANSKEEQPA